MFTDVETLRYYTLKVLPLVYDDATYFNNGIASVKLYGKWLRINKQGEHIIKTINIHKQKE